MPNAKEDVQYPREIVVPAGLPAGWKGIEKMYGPGSKYEGTTYVRWYTLDGRHKHVLSAKAVIKIDAEEKGYDADAALKVYEQKQKEKRERSNAERHNQKEDRYILKGEAREAAIKIFTDKFGGLRGSLVHAFKGWRTRWDYMPNCGQIHVTYTDPEGLEWKLLKNLEAAFGRRMQEGEDFTAFIAKAEAHENPEKFKEGSQTAKATQGSYESSALDDVDDPVDQREAPGKRADEKYEESPIRVVLATSPVDEGGADPSLAARLSQLLQGRGFAEPAALLRVSSREPGHNLAETLSGVYYELGHPFNDRPCYQWVAESATNPGQLFCAGLYLSWGGIEQKRWKLGSLDIARAGFAYCEDDAKAPTALLNPWMLVKRDKSDRLLQGKERERSRSPKRAAS